MLQYPNCTLKSLYDILKGDKNKVAGHVKHRLLDLIHDKEKQLGRRLLVSEIATGANVSERLVYRWLDPTEEVKRFDEPALVGFCSYFNVSIGDLLVYEAEEEGKQ